jgi:hypothetical protein
MTDAWVLPHIGESRRSITVAPPLFSVGGRTPKRRPDRCALVIGPTESHPSLAKYHTPCFKERSSFGHVDVGASRKAFSCDLDPFASPRWRLFRQRMPSHNVKIRASKTPPMKRASKATWPRHPSAPLLPTKPSRRKSWRMLPVRQQTPQALIHGLSRRPAPINRRAGETSLPRPIRFQAVAQSCPIGIRPSEVKRHRQS